MMVKICKRCGKEFEINSRLQNSKIYCSEECSQVVIKTRKQRKQKARKSFVSERKCKRCDCLYSPPKWDRNGCDYMYLTGEKRGCPAGDGCTRYKKSTPSERSKYRKIVMDKWDVTFARTIK